MFAGLPSNSKDLLALLQFKDRYKYYLISIVSCTTRYFNYDMQMHFFDIISTDIILLSLQ